MEKEIIEAARNLVRVIRNNNSVAQLIFDTKSVSYPFLELEKLFSSLPTEPKQEDGNFKKFSLLKESPTIATDNTMPIKSEQQTAEGEKEGWIKDNGKLTDYKEIVNNKRITDTDLNYFENVIKTALESSGDAERDMFPDKGGIDIAAILLCEVKRLRKESITAEGEIKMWDNEVAKIAQWVIDNRYPKSDDDKVSDWEMFIEVNKQIEEIISLKSSQARTETLDDVYQVAIKFFTGHHLTRIREELEKLKKV